MSRWWLSVASAWPRGRAIALIGYFAIAFCSGNALAQMTPDDTLGVERSIVTPLDAQGLPIDRIDGGAIRGENLFHSFLEFNVVANRGAYFFSPANIQNILTRVTGGNPSEILGTLGTFGTSSPNLFLINPNGIIFGLNASLDIGGSFVATTANTIQLEDRGLFSASEPSSSNLLSIQPSTFFFNALSNPAIVNRSIATVTVLGIPTNGLQVPDGQSLVLLGGDVNLTGGRLTSPGGRIELGGVTGAGTVELNADGNNLSLSFPDAVVRADVSLTNSALVNVSGEGGGTVRVEGRQVTLTDGSRIGAITLGARAGGTLTVTASESVELIGASADGQFVSSLLSSTFSTGKAGDLTIATRRLIVRDGAGIFAGTRPGSQGQGGTLSVTASDFVELSGIKAGSDGQFVSGLFTDTLGTGAAGDLTINTGRLNVQAGAVVATRTFGEGEAGNLTVIASDSVELSGAAPGERVVSGLFTGTFGTGASGDLTIDTPRLTIRDGAAVSAETRGEGQGGQLTVVNSDSVELIGTTANLQSGSALSTATAGAGAAGDLTVNTGKLTVRDGAAISTATLGEGRAGTLTINASESVEVSGTDAADLFVSGLTTQTVGAGAAGDLTINTGQLTISDRAKILAATTGGESGSIIVTANAFEATRGGQLRTTTQGSKDAGDITLNVLDSVILAGEDSGLFANTDPDSTGNGGSIFISNPETVLVRDGARIAVDSQGAGTGGNIEIRADSITLDNRANLSAETASNTGGDITLSLDDWLLMRRGSRISTTAGTAQQGGDGGNIAIEADLVVAVPDENSDITANAFSGRGGGVTITTQGLYNFVIRSREEIQALLGTDDLSQFDTSQLPTNDITAISQTSPTLSQLPVVNLLGIDPSQGLVELSTELVDVSRLVEQNLCAASQGSTFTVTGRGGLPAPPGETLNADAAWEDWRITSESESSIGTPPMASVQTSEVTKRSPQTIIEAQGWVKDANGNIVLTAEPMAVTPHETWLVSANCQ